MPPSSSEVVVPITGNWFTNRRCHRMIELPRAAHGLAVKVTLTRAPGPSLCRQIKEREGRGERRRGAAGARTCKLEKSTKEKIMSAMHCDVMCGKKSAGRAGDGRRCTGTAATTSPQSERSHCGKGHLNYFSLSVAGELSCSRDARDARSFDDVTDDVCGPSVHFLQLLAESGGGILGQNAQRVT